MSAPGYLHPPPGDLAEHRLPISEHPGPWLRLHRHIYRAIYFDRSSMFRFNAVDGAYGVLYCGGSLECCLLETLLRLDTPHHTTFRTVSRDALRERSLSPILFRRSLRLVDLTGAGLNQIGAHEALCSGPYEQVRPWSWALWSHPDRPDGLLYRARHNPSHTSVAIFDRAQDAVHAGTAQPLLALSSDVAVILDRYRISLR